ncbi:MAG: TIGR00725 family protein [Candidatus Jordarchaeum sp.]|uniref:TIGR00725 family protein n=1 Tax=Candidatus Jordarchaeum sp. TaxID=2823881 RepID=UPI00404AB386
MPLQIGVIGSDGPINESVKNLAEEIGRLVARHGMVLICGGRSGVMEAAARGAKKENGITVGVIPGNNKKEANPFCDIVIATGIGRARNLVVVNSSDVVVAISGGAGTLSEIALALAENKLVIVLKGSGGVSNLVAGKLIGDSKVVEALSPQAAIEIILKYWKY